MSYGGHPSHSYAYQYKSSSYSSPQPQSYSYSQRPSPGYFASESNHPQYFDSQKLRQTVRNDGAKDPNCVLRKIQFRHRECYAQPAHIMTMYKVLGKRCSRHAGTQPPRACHEESQNGRSYTDGSATEDACPKCEAMSPGARGQLGRSDRREHYESHAPSTSTTKDRRRSPDHGRERDRESSGRPKLKRGQRYPT